MQTTDARLTNPLNLDVAWVRSIEAPHDVTDEAKREALTDAMDRDGWVGAPLVASRTGYEGCQNRAYTGSHRIEAWEWSEIGEGAPLPVVFIEDLAERHGIDFAALLTEHDGDDWQAATALAYQLPTDVIDAYGLDLH